MILPPHDGQAEKQVEKKTGKQTLQPPAKKKRRTYCETMDERTLEEAIYRHPFYKSIEHFKTEHPKKGPGFLSERKLRDMLNPEHPDYLKGTPNTIGIIADDLGVIGYERLIENPRGEVDDLEGFELRMAYMACIRALGSNIYEMSDEGKPRKKNMLYRFDNYLTKNYRHLRPDDGRKCKARVALRRDGWIEQLAEDYWVIAGNSPLQIDAYRNVFLADLRTRLELAVERCRADGKLHENLKESITDQFKRVDRAANQGLRFLFHRRRLYEAFGLEMGTLGETLGLLLDAVDQPYLQCRCLLKHLHGGLVTAEYRATIKEINAPSLRELRKIRNNVVADKMFSPKRILKWAEQDLKRIEAYYKLRKELEDQLMADGELTAEDIKHI